MTKFLPKEKKIDICPVCKKEILSTESKSMIAVEKPYCNIYVHRECWLKVKDNLLEFLTEYFKTNVIFKNM